MTKDLVGFFCWLVGGGVMLYSSQELQAPALWLLVLGLLIFSFDSLLLTSWGKTTSRVAPLPALALLFSGGMGFVVASVALLAGGLLLCFSRRSRKMIPGDLCRSLGPLGAAPAQGLDLPEPLPQLAVMAGFLVLSLVLEPRRFALRPTLLGLFCAPWIALSCFYMGQFAPWSLILMVPVLVGLSSGKDDMFPVLR